MTRQATTNLLWDRVRPFLVLSHPLPTVPPSLPRKSNLWTPYHYYSIGPQDVLFVIGWGVLLSVLRLVIMSVLKRFARWYLSRNDPKPLPILPPTSPKVLKSNGHSNGEGSGLISRKANGAAPNGVAKRPNAANGEHEWSDAQENAQSASRRKSRFKLDKKIKLRERTSTRFAEQGFALVYYVVMWTFGLWIHMNVLENPLETSHFWSTYPQTHLPAPVKAYYLIALTSYSLQLVILNLEAPRGDHWQMFTHHVFTVTLILGSYLVRITTIGCAILFILDWCDIWLPLAKMVKYLDIPVLPDVAFVIFLVSWFITRQIYFVKLVLSVTFESHDYLDFVWDPSTERYMTYWGLMTFAACLWVLVLLLCIWFYMGCKVAWNVVTGKGADDSRSDDEDVESEDTASSTTSQHAASKEKKG